MLTVKLVEGKKYRIKIYGNKVGVYKGFRRWTRGEEVTATWHIFHEVNKFASVFIISQNNLKGKVEEIE